jgi:amicoumacin kinase
MMSRTLAVEAVRCWFATASKPTHVQDSDNSVYSFEIGDPARRYFLRLTHPEHRQLNQIQAELDFVLYLNGEGFPVSRPVLSMENRLVERVSAEYFACVFEAATGALVEVGSSDWSKKLFLTWGNFMGRMHRAAERYVPRGPKRFRWDEDEVLVNIDNNLPANETSARRELDHVLIWLEHLPSDTDRFGMIHGDLCRVNFHYNGKEIIAYDFDDCCYHWFVYDLVCALAPAMFRPLEERSAYRNWLIEGYQQAKTLSETWKEEFDWLLRLRSVYIFTHYIRKSVGEIENHPKRRLLELLLESFDRPITW